MPYYVILDGKGHWKRTDPRIADERVTSMRTIKEYIAIFLVAIAIVIGIIWVQKPEETRYDALSSVLMNIAALLGLFGAWGAQRIVATHYRLSAWGNFLLVPIAFKYIVMVEVILGVVYALLKSYSLFVDPSYNVPDIIGGLALWIPGIILLFTFFGLVTPSNGVITLGVTVFSTLVVFTFIAFFVGVYFPGLFGFGLEILIGLIKIWPVTLVMALLEIGLIWLIANRRSTLATLLKIYRRISSMKESMQKLILGLFGIAVMILSPDLLLAIIFGIAGVLALIVAFKDYLDGN